MHTNFGSVITPEFDILDVCKHVLVVLGPITQFKVCKIMVHWKVQSEKMHFPYLNFDFGNLVDKLCMFEN